MPDERVLRALHDDLHPALNGAMFGGKPLTVRPHRHRDSKEWEFPCLAIRRVSADPSGTYGRETNDYGLPEAVWELSVDLVIDVNLPPEDDETLAADPTGYATPSQIVAAVLNQLFPDQETGGEENTLAGHAWMMRYDGSAPDALDATPDGIRVEERLVVLYRVRADRPTHLLMGN